MKKPRRRNFDSPIHGIKELFDKARSATPLRLVRKGFSPTPDVVRLETQIDAAPIHITDNHVDDEIDGADATQPGVTGPLRTHSDAQPQHPTEQAAPPQANSLDRTTGDVDQTFIPPNNLSPKQNKVFLFPSQSKSSDMTSPQSQCLAETDFGPVSSVPIQKSLQQQNKRNQNNCALETKNDRIYEDMLSAWWFLGSRSYESEELTSSESKEKVGLKFRMSSSDEHSKTQPADNLENNTTKDRTSGSSKHSMSSWILRSFSSEKTHSLKIKGSHSSSSSNVLEMSQQPLSASDSRLQVNPGIIEEVSSFVPNKQPQPKGGNYTRKEVAKRQEWMVGLGGTVNYDRPYGGDCESIASYQLYPMQKDNLQIDTTLSMREDSNKSPDWDPSLLPKRKTRTFEDWTPQDSSYSAAVPVCGWIPKRIRKLIEIIFFLAVTALIIFLVVKIGIKLTGNEHQSSSGIDLDLLTDDDRYIAKDANNNANVDDIADHDDCLYQNEGAHRLRRKL